MFNTGQISSAENTKHGSVSAVLITAAPSFQQPSADRALDQWRGFALILVLISHGFYFTGHVPGIGRIGVNLFFFISGILVFRSLSRGPQKFWPGVRYFGVRKLKRLIPAKYFYLFCMAILVLFLSRFPAFHDFKPSFFSELPSCLFYYYNYYVSPWPIAPELLTGHLWSLSCEMQFYALAPLIYFAGGISVSRRFIVFGIVLAMMLATGLKVLGKPDLQYNPYTFGASAWPMMAGFFAEFFYRIFPKQCLRLSKPLVWCGILALIALIPAIASVHKQTVILAGSLLLGGSLGCYWKGIAPGGIVGNTCHFLGNRTYSIYLWQQPLTLGGLVPPFFSPFGSLISVALGILSFNFLERPFMSKFKAKTPPAN